MAFETSEYLRPGAYIGQLIRPSASNVTGFPRLPCFIAKGSRLARAKNSEVIRAKVYDEELTFTGVGPYSALLAFQADGSKARTELLADGARVPNSSYTFATTVVANDTILIPSQFFSQTATYIITYQSVDRTVLDPMPFNNLRQIERVGRGVDSSEFLEFTDFIIPVTVGAPAAGGSNTLTTSTVYGAVGGPLATVVLVGPQSITLTGEDRFSFLAVAVAGGAEGVVENVGTRTVTITFVTGVSTAASIVATVTTALTALTLVGAVSGAGAGVWLTVTHEQTKMASTFDAGGGNTGDGDVGLASTAQYTHPYTRDYTVTCTTGGATSAAVFVWSSTPNSLGNTMAVHNPHPDLVAASAFRNAITNPGDFLAITLEYGLQVVFHDQNGTFDVGDTWTFRAFGAGRVEADLRHSASNQFTEFSDVDDVGTPSGLGVFSIASAPSAYTGTYNRTYQISVSAIGVGPASATVKWSAVGDDGIATGTTAALVDEATALLDNGVTIAIDLTPGAAVVGDEYTFTVSAPRYVPTIKDDRTYIAEVNVPLTGDVTWLFFTDTPEGGIGTFTSTTADSHVELDGNLVIHVRNLVGPRYAAANTFTWTVTLDDVIDWSLQTEVTESIDAADIIHDVLGRVTGTPDTYYVVLRNAPDEDPIVTNSDDDIVSATVITAGGENTRFLDFGATSPDDDLTVVYQFKGKEPNPGVAYRVSALYLRGADLYNVPILVTDEATGIALAEPMGSDNHMAIVNALAFDYEPIGIYLCQVQDGDDDGIYQVSDYEEAIESTESTKAITDIIVLDAFDTLAKQIEHADSMANPLLNKQRLIWIGAPVGTPIGDVNTAGSLVYTAQVTCAVAGDSQAHGTRIMVGPTTCVRTITFNDGTPSQDLDLDGSFVAAAFALQYASFRNPSFTALHKNLTVFKDVQVYSEPEENRLGTAQIVYVTQIGTGIYQWAEDTTTDPVGTDNSPQEFSVVSAMMQKRYMNRRLQAAVDSTVISMVPDSPEAGLAILTNVIVNTVQQDVTNKMIGEFLNEDGNVRRMNPSSDVLTYRDRERNTVYRFFVAYFIKLPIKQVFGQALTDSNSFQLASGGL